MSMKDVIFKIGDRVNVLFDSHLKNLEVVDPCDKTDMVLLNGDAVEFYVRVKDQYGVINGYHQENLELVGD